MRPDKVEVSWDAAKSSWLIRIEVGEEVVRRHANLPKAEADDALRAAAAGRSSSPRFHSSCASTGN
jgi:hypothetical protein